MLFMAYGYLDVDEVCTMIARTAVFDVPTIRDMLYVTLQHAASVRTREEALDLLNQYMQSGNSATPHHPRHQSTAAASSTTSLVEDLLHANVLPHLALPKTKMAPWGGMVDQPCVPKQRISLTWLASCSTTCLIHSGEPVNNTTRIFWAIRGWRSVEHCWDNHGGPSVWGCPCDQQIRNSLYRMRGFVNFVRPCLLRASQTRVE